MYPIDQPQILQIPALDIISIIASIASLALAGIAIWLSIKFYQMSTSQAKEIEKSSENIVASVEKLEQLFDKLYSGTFSMMRDTVSEMSKHAWSRNEVKEINQKEETIINEEFKKFKAEKNLELSKIIDDLTATNAEVKDMKSDLKTKIQDILNNSIDKTRKIDEDIRNKELRMNILRFIKENNPVKYSRLLEHYNKINVDTSTIGLLLFKLQEDGLLRIRPQKFDLTNNSQIILNEIEYLLLENDYK